jgi:hypothetical protein
MTPKIYMFCPTVRYAMMLETIKFWIEKASGKVDIYYTIDAHDRNKSMTRSVQEYLRNLECNDTDIIGFVSDDIYCPQDWDLEFIKETEGYCGAVQFNDNIRRGNLIFSIGCVTFAAIKKLNRLIGHPDYYHNYSDNEFYDNLNALGLYKDVSATNPATFDHKHWCMNTRERDATDIKASDYFLIDQATYARRKAMPIEERLKWE